MELNALGDTSNIKSAEFLPVYTTLDLSVIRKALESRAQSWSDRVTGSGGAGGRPMVTYESAFLEAVNRPANGFLNWIVSEPLCHCRDTLKAANIT
jgi:hypothetical protein